LNFTKGLHRFVPWHPSIDDMYILEFGTCPTLRLIHLNPTICGLHQCGGTFYNSRLKQLLSFI